MSRLWKKTNRDLPGWEFSRTNFRRFRHPRPPATVCTAVIPPLTRQPTKTAKGKPLIRVLVLELPDNAEACCVFKRSEGKWTCIQAPASFEFFTRASIDAIQTFLRNQNIAYYWPKVSAPTEPPYPKAPSNIPYGCTNPAAVSSLNEKTSLKPVAPTPCDSGNLERNGIPSSPLNPSHPRGDIAGVSQRPLNYP